MKPPRIPSVFKLSDHNSYKRFDYKPRTYDEQKEKLEKRQRQVEKELAIEQRLGKNYEAQLREKISNSWSRKETRRQSRNSSIRLLVILAILVLIIFAIYSKLDF